MNRETAAADGLYYTHHVGEEEPGMRELEVLEQRVQLEAVEGAPGAVQVLPRLRLLPAVVVVQELVDDLGRPAAHRLGRGLVMVGRRGGGDRGRRRRAVPPLAGGGRRGHGMLRGGGDAAAAARRRVGRGDALRGRRHHGGRRRDAVRRRGRDLGGVVAGHERPRPLHHLAGRLAAPREAELERGAAAEHVELVGHTLYVGDENRSLARRTEWAPLARVPLFPHTTNGRRKNKAIT